MAGEKIAFMAAEATIPVAQSAALSLLKGSGMMVSSAREFAAMRAGAQSHLPVGHEELHGVLNSFKHTGEVLLKPFKVLASDGTSPGAPGVRWPLPRFESSGQWKPGEWLHINQTPSDAYSLNGMLMPQTRRALHVSNEPSQWRLGHTQVRLFEAELSAPDRALWEHLVNGQKFTSGQKFNSTQKFASSQYFASGDAIPVSLRDFPARQVRLTREVVGDEMAQIMGVPK